MSAPRHILVVDDDGDVRQIIADLLLDLGYRVSLAAGGEAMGAFLDAADPVDLVVLDATMPGEPSVSLALRAKENGIRVVMISGSPDKMKAAHDKVDQLLYKPFRSAELARAIHHALASETFGQRTEDPD
jgi:DNA-binding response OmpR family regulator